MGELGSLPQHLNLTPQEGDRLTGCQLVAIQCAFCLDDIQRNGLKEHEEDLCPERPYSCEYCEEYESTYKDLTANHIGKSALPVQCHVLMNVGDRPS